MTSIKAKLTAILASVALAASLSVPAFAYEQVEDTVSYGHGYNDAGYLVIHETANPGASAYNHTLLWSRDDTFAVHYVMELDGSVVYHTVPDWALCWHVGNGNYATVGIELAHATNWEDFAARLDEPLGQFIKIYRPNCFDRVGLRFVNAISREQLGLTGRRWNDLLQPPYLGILDEDDVDEASVAKCSVDVERKLDTLAALKLHAGPGFVQRNIRSGNQVQQVQEKEVRFIFDQDVYSIGKVKVAAVAETLNALHAHSDSVFSDAITTVLHDAMEPEYL